MGCKIVFKKQDNPHLNVWLVWFHMYFEEKLTDIDTSLSLISPTLFHSTKRLRSNNNIPTTLIMDNEKIDVMSKVV